MKLVVLPAIMLVALAAIAGSPAYGAGSGFEGSNSGFGEESVQGVWNCGANEYVHVSASVDDNGAVEGHGDCMGASADCQGHGFCTDGSGPTNTGGAAGIGNCRGRGDGGAWTKFKLRCWSTDAGSSGAGVASSDAPGVDATVVEIEGIPIRAVGKLCVPGSQCKPVSVTCSIGILEWSCQTRA